MATKFEELDDAGKLAEIKKRLANVRYGYDVGDVNQSYAKHVEWLLALSDRQANAVDKLAAFKQWVHAYLDGKGVPTHPDGPHSKEGCRVGDRMDLVFAELDELRARPAETAEVTDGNPPATAASKELP